MIFHNSYNGRIQEVIAVSEPTIASVLWPLAEMDGQVATASLAVNLPSYCSSPCPLVRASSALAKARLKEFWTSIFENTALYQTLRHVAAQDGLMEADERRLLDRYMRQFSRNGMDLLSEDRAKLTALRSRESALCSEFEQTVNENTDAVYFPPEELKGVSENYLANLSVDPITGKLKVGLKFPEASPVLQYADKANTRRITDTARLQRCPTNAQRLAELVSVRCQAAQLLGYASHADFVLEARMAKNSPTVNAFVDNLVAQLSATGRQEQQALEKFVADLRGTTQVEPVQPHDLRYYERLQRELSFKLDEQEISEYFPMPHVLEELMKIYSSILGLRFNKVGVETKGICVFACCIRIFIFAYFSWLGHRNDFDRVGIVDHR